MGLRSDVDLAIYPEGAEVIIGVITRIDGGDSLDSGRRRASHPRQSRVNLISTELPRGGSPPRRQVEGKAEFGFWSGDGKQKESNNY